MSQELENLKTYCVGRLHELELRIQKLETNESQTSEKVGQMEKNAGKAIWLVFASIITGVMAFILRGGLYGMDK